MQENELAKRLNPRLSDVLESVAAKHGEDHAVAIERALKTMAIMAHMLEMIRPSDRRFAEVIAGTAMDNISTLLGIIGVDPEDVHGASKASVSDFNDLFKKQM